MLASGTYEDERVTGRGAVEVKVISDLLVEFGIKPARSEPYLGGQTIRMAGVLENTSDDTVVGVTVYPTTDGNAGNGIVFPADAGGRTPDTPYGSCSSPSRRSTCRACCPRPRSRSPLMRRPRGRCGPGTTRSTRPPARSPRPLRPNPRSGARHGRLQRLDGDADPPAEILPDVVGECGYAYFGCGVIVGLDNLASGSFDLVRLAGNIGLDAARPVRATDRV